MMIGFKPLDFALSEAHEPNMVQGEALLKGEACSSRPKAGPSAQRSLSGAISALRSLRLGVRRLDDFMRHSFKVMHDELHTVKVRISCGWARWVGEKIWHESQRAKKNGDGSLELSFRVAGLEEIKRWVLSFGPDILVLEPERLKEMVRKDLSRNLAQYSKPLVSVNLVKEMRAI